MPPCLDLCEFELSAEERLEFGLKGWEYDANLTGKYLNMIGDWSPIKPVDVTFRVYRKTEEDIKGKYDILIYGLANVYPTDTEYVLMKQGSIDSEGEIQFYSQQSLIEETMSK